MIVENRKIVLPADDWDDCFSIINIVTVPFAKHGLIPLDPARVITFPGRKLLAFAKTRSSSFPDFLGVDAATHHVLCFSESGSVMQFVNSDLAAYSDCAHLFLAGAPYKASDEAGHQLDERDTACERLLAAFKRRDPHCVAPASYWQDRISDVDAGDWDFDDE